MYTRFTALRDLGLHRGLASNTEIAIRSGRSGSSARREHSAAACLLDGI